MAGTPGRTVSPAAACRLPMTPVNGAYNLQSSRFLRAMPYADSAWRSRVCASTHLIWGRLLAS